MDETVTRVKRLVTPDGEPKMVMTWSRDEAGRYYVVEETWVNMPSDEEIQKGLEELGKRVRLSRPPDTW